MLSMRDTGFGVVLDHAGSPMDTPNVMGVPVVPVVPVMPIVPCSVRF
jgi:hypothetical protein